MTPQDPGSGGRERPAATVRLVDDGADGGRTTASLVASLASRLAALRLLSGADTFGSLTAGYAALGRRVASTADGARLREALDRGRAGGNCRAVWAALGIDDLATVAASPVVDHLRNDLALLLADDLDDALDRVSRPDFVRTDADDDDDGRPADAVDYLVGMWAYAREVLAGIEMLAAETLPPSGGVRPAPVVAGTPDGPLLR